jgi:ribosomal-protein-alanine N-acetyltransferase
VETGREPAGVSVRPARLDDLDAIMALERRLFPPADRFPARQYRGYLRADPDLVLVAELDGVVVGCAAGGVEPAGGHVHTIGVDPAAQRRGVGRALVAGLLAAFAARQARRVVLEVRSGNVAAIALYRSLGFVATRKLPAYYPDGEDGLRMWRLD